MRETRPRLNRKKCEGFTAKEIDAAECWLTIGGAKKWRACKDALDGWRRDGGGPIKITAEALRNFQRRHPRARIPEWCCNPWFSSCPDDWSCCGCFAYCDPKKWIETARWIETTRCIKARIMREGRRGKP